MKAAIPCGVLRLDLRAEHGAETSFTAGFSRRLDRSVPDPCDDGGVHAGRADQPGHIRGTWNSSMPNSLKVGTSGNGCHATCA